MFRRRPALPDAVAADLVRWADPSEHAGLLKTAERRGILLAVQEDAARRSFHADAEELAEGGIPEFLEELREPLARLGAELPDDVAVAETDLDTWAQAPIDAFCAVNAALERAGSDERLYALYGGNDLFALLLTDALRDQFHATEPPRERPYIPLPDDPGGARQRELG